MPELMLADTLVWLAGWWAVIACAASAGFLCGAWWAARP